jgi:hypothetical protein
MIMVFTSFPKLTLSSSGSGKTPYKLPASLFINEGTEKFYKYRKSIISGDRRQLSGLTAKNNRKKLRRRLNKTKKQNAKRKRD